MIRWSSRSICRPRNSSEPGIVNTVAEVLRKTGLPANRLELEITEGTLME